MINGKLIPAGPGYDAGDAEERQDAEAPQPSIEALESELVDLGAGMLSIDSPVDLAAVVAQQGTPASGLPGSSSERVADAELSPETALVPRLQSEKS